MRKKTYVHKLKDDLEAFIYIVLYSALRWLPVKSEHSLEWWLDEFFTVVPAADWCGSPVHKKLNASDRTFTKGLKSKASTKVLEWLRAAMDLHCNRILNPLWDDGKVLGDMWRRKLEDDIPNKDRQEDKARSIGFRDKQPLPATLAARPSIRLPKDAQRSIHSPTSAKRPRSVHVDRAEGSPSKRSKPNWKGDFCKSRPLRWSFVITPAKTDSTGCCSCCFGCGSPLVAAPVLGDLTTAGHISNRNIRTSNFNSFSVKRQCDVFVFVESFQFGVPLSSAAHQ